MELEEIKKEIDEYLKANFDCWSDEQTIDDKIIELIGNTEDVESFEIVWEYVREKFNFVCLQNGEDYFVGKTKKDWKWFFTQVEISSNDLVWCSRFKYEDFNYPMNIIYSEVMEEDDD